MISPARATGIIALGTAAQLLSAVAVSKALAILTGPQGVGFYALLQSLLGLASLGFGLGVGTGIVRATARALADGDKDRPIALRNAAIVIAFAGGLAGGGAFVLLREPIAATFLGGRPYAWAVVVVAPALLLGLLASVESGCLNGHYRIRATALATAASSFAGAAVVIPLVAAAGTDALPWAILGVSVASVLVATVARRRSIVGTYDKPAAPGLFAALRWFAGFGGSYTLSQLAGTGVQLLVPVIVLSMLGHEAVGYVRAASAIAVGYLGFLLTSMGREYYPRAAATATTATALQRLVADQGRLVMALSVPLILATSALAPMVISILYSDAFLPATGVLQWMLVGDVLKLLSWTGSFVILARASATRYFVIEFIGGGCLLLTTVVATAAYGVVGVGVAYSVTYAIYLGVVWAAARPIVRIPVTPAVMAGLALAIALAALQLARPALPPIVATGALLTAALVAAGWSVRTIRRSDTVTLNLEPLHD